MTQNWNVPTNADDYFRTQEKRMLHQERRPSVKSAAELLGPGFGPFAIQTINWSDDTTAFNGFFYSAPGSMANSPDDTKWWIGQTISIPDGFGVQRVWEFHDSDAFGAYDRRFTNFSGSSRVYSAWAAGAGGGGTTDAEVAALISSVATATRAALDSLYAPAPGIILVDNGASVPPGTPVGTIIAEKA